MGEYAVMKVKEIATAAGVNPDTVRFYTREGLLQPTRNPDNNYQQYDAEDLRRLRFARKARQLGFSLIRRMAVVGGNLLGAVVVAAGTASPPRLAGQFN